MLPIQKKYVGYNYSARSSKPKYIVIHDTGNPGASANNHYNYFSGGNRGASADFFVDSNNIIQIINTDVNYSWAVGDGKGVYGITNANSCSIEMCLEKDGVPSEATINNTIELTRYLMSYYGVSINNVVRHYDCSRKSCPCSFMANNWAKWHEFKARLSSGNIATENKEMNYSMYVFSKEWYLKRYPDVAANAIYKDNPYDHYEKHGKNEGRQPLPPIPKEYNEGAYLELNPDVAEAVKKGTYTSGLHHYLCWGFNEPRKICHEDSVEAIKKRCKELEIKLEEIKKIIV